MQIGAYGYIATNAFAAISSIPAPGQGIGWKDGNGDHYFAGGIVTSSIKFLSPTEATLTMQGILNNQHPAVAEVHISDTEIGVTVKDGNTGQAVYTRSYAAPTAPPGHKPAALSVAQ